MPWKVIYFLFIVLMFALFAGFNLHNKCNISLIFYEFKDLPVYILNIFSFLVGIILTLPFFWGNSKNKKKQQHNSDISGIKNVNLKPQKKFFFWNKKNKSANAEEDLTSSKANATKK